MNFFNMNFSTLFLQKHGQDEFDKICTIISQEQPNQYSNNYIELIFKLAFLDFFGLSIQVIENILNDSMQGLHFNITEVKIIHKESIKHIQRNLKDAMNETIDIN